MKDRIRKIKQYEKLLEARRWTDVKDIENIKMCPCDYKQGNTPPPDDKYTPFENKGEWGTGKDSHAWFKFDLTAGEKVDPMVDEKVDPMVDEKVDPMVDEKVDPMAGENVDLTAGRKATYLRVHGGTNGWDATNPQFLLYVNSKIRQGMDTNHRTFLLDKGPCHIDIYAYTGPKIERCRFFADTATLDTETDGLYFDILYPLQMLDYLNPESGEYAAIVDFLFNTVSFLRFDSDDYAETVRRARTYINEEFYGKYCREQYFKVVGIGHTHIDCAWQWTLLQTKEKVQRSFGTVLELMKRYPEYKFMSSQALLYKDLKEEAPELYSELKERIKEKRWECEGAMWVEADCNLPDGESLVRQVLYGKNFFRQEFGTDNRVLWLPDVFGYSAALPQILKKAGVDWFVTSKISWNDTDRMPYDTFLWRGIDGTGINSYFLTAQNNNGDKTSQRATYNASTEARMIEGTYKRYSQKELSAEALLTFGFGDGGGGPTQEMLELMRRSSKGIPGSPQTSIEFAGDFLHRLEKRIENNPKLPVWQGELYLEFHRGTYTSQAHNKRNNRKAETGLRRAEFLSSVTKALLGTEYPQGKLHETWENVLTNQFHDIIPGSSIREVYEQCDRDYAKILGTAGEISQKAEEAIASKTDKNKGFVVFNPLGFPSDGIPVRVNGVTLLPKSQIPPLGYAAVGDFVSDNHIKIEGHSVETDALKVEFDENWLINSFYDKKNKREVLKTGQKGNELRLYQDYPDTYDAWEWQAYERDEYSVITAFESAETVNDGVRRGLRIVRPFGKSRLTQTVWFTDDSLNAVFETEVEWQESHRMLKAAFPVDINSDKASYEIQFGTTERPTHFNTSWDRARFEVCAHKFADYSEGNYGVSLCNDCKYGYDIHEGLMQLSLLRAPGHPDPLADRGHHIFTYALCPHSGTLNESDTLRFASFLNAPLTAVAATGSKSSLPASFSAVSVENFSLICQTVKLSEDGSGTVLRFYEGKNMRGHAKIRIGLPFTKAYLCNLLEENISELPVSDSCFELDFKGFEIITVKLI